MTTVCTIGTMFDCNPFELMFAISFCILILVIAKLMYNSFTDEHKEEAEKKALQTLKNEIANAQQDKSYDLVVYEE